MHGLRVTRDCMSGVLTLHCHCNIWRLCATIPQRYFAQGGNARLAASLQMAQLKVAAMLGHCLCMPCGTVCSYSLCLRDHFPILQARAVCSSPKPKAP